MIFGSGAKPAKPFAWAVITQEEWGTGTQLFLKKAAAVQSAKWNEGTLVDLFIKQPTLTDAEREAVLDAALAYEGDPDEWECAKIAATLRGLLDRTQTGRK